MIFEGIIFCAALIIDIAMLDDELDELDEVEPERSTVAIAAVL